MPTQPVLFISPAPCIHNFRCPQGRSALAERANLPAKRATFAEPETRAIRLNENNLRDLEGPSLIHLPEATA
jgi:hypothetical protein